MNAPARKPAATAPEAQSADALPFRTAPHNIEAEQALLGAILVNNEAHDRVSGFLEAEHFYDPLHQQIYETAAKIITSGKQATPITLKTFFDKAEPIDAGLTVPQYLGRLAANAATIINARDYGRTIRDLATRRQLILIGEDMVNVAFDSPVDFPPKEQIEDAETKLFSLAENDKYGQGFLGFNTALTNAVDMAGNAYKRDGNLSGISTKFSGLDNKMGGLQASDLIVLAGRPSMGKTALATNIAFNVARARLRSWTERPELPADDHQHDGGVVGFFSLEMSAEQLATRILSEQAGIGSEKIRRGMISEQEFKQLGVGQPGNGRHPALHRPDRRYLHRPALRARPPPQAPARAWPADRRLSPADDRQLQQERQPRPGGVADHHRPQGPGQGIERAGDRPVAALARGGKPRGQAPATRRPA
jgi:replicative DNA helicase